MTKYGGSLFIANKHQSKLVDKELNYVIWEHPHFFKDYKYNQKKLLLHKGSMKYYFDYLKKK